MRPWYARNAQALLQTRQNGARPDGTVVVSLVGGDFSDVAATTLYVAEDMPLPQMDWRMLADLPVWVWADQSAPLERIVTVTQDIARKRPRELFVRFSTTTEIHDVDCGNGLHRKPVSGVGEEHSFFWLPVNVGGTRIGEKVCAALKRRMPERTWL